MIALIQCEVEMISDSMLVINSLEVIKGGANSGALCYNELVIITTSVTVSSNSLCVRSNLNSAIEKSIKESLLSMHNTAGVS